MKLKKNFNWEGVNFSVELKDIDKFEKMNLDISVNVLGLEGDDKVYPLRISEFVYKRKHDVNLLLISDEESEIKHYCLVNNLSRLLSMQVNKDEHSEVFCLRYFSHFGNEDLLNDHLEYCTDNVSVKVNMPKFKKVKVYDEEYESIKPKIEFKNYKNMIKHPFFVVADFESFIIRLTVVCETK